MKFWWRNSAIFGVLSKLVELAKIFFLTVYAAKVLDITSFGAFSLLLSVSSIVAVLAEFRLQEIVFREVSKNTNPVKVAFDSIYIGIFFAFIGYIVLYLVSKTSLVEGAMPEVYEIYGFVFFLGVSRILKIIFVAKEKGLSVFALECISAAIAVLYLLVLHSGNASIDLVDIVFARIVDGGVVLAGMIFLFSFLYRIDFYPPTFEKIIYYLTQSFPLVLSGIAVILYQKIDQIMIKQILGLEQLAIYSANIQVVTTLAIIPIVMAQVLARNVHIASVSKDKVLTQVLYMRMIVWSGLGLTILSFLFGTTAVRLLFGDEYIISSTSFIFMSLIPLLTALGASSTHVLVSDGLQGLVWVKSVLALLINIALNLMLIPYIGIMGGAISTFIALLVGNVLSNYLISKYRYVFFLQVFSLCWIKKWK